jgi:ATP-dependent DNA helicase RecQ
MTRAKEELVLCSLSTSPFVTQAGLVSQVKPVETTTLPQILQYLDLTPKDVNLGHATTRHSQDRILQLREGMPLQLKVNQRKKGWEIWTEDGVSIGALSRWGSQRKLPQKGIHLGFNFQPGEVSVRHIYRHLKRDELTGEVQEDWYVVIPQIRICR